MKFKFDLHIHSALSPCAEKEMTPVTIVGSAALIGLDFVAIADHNAIGHVPVAMKAGDAFGVSVVPAVEVQTNEDIHLLCLFPTYGELEAFFRELPLSERKNRADLFGEQLYFDEDDNIVGTEHRMLLDSMGIGCESVRVLAERHGGVAVPAHIDRDANSMLKILGAVPPEYRTVELSTRVGESDFRKWSEERLVIVDSDAHTLEDVSARGEIELPEGTVEALIATPRRGK